MDRKIALLGVLLLVASGAAYGDIYEWTDSAGVVHFTDNQKKVPKGAKKVQRRKSTVLPAPFAEKKGPAPQAPPEKPPVAESYGGHDPVWWRAQFIRLRHEVQEHRARLAEAQNKVAGFQAKKFYEFINRQEYANWIDTADAEKMAVPAAEKRLADLERQADAAGLPSEYRR